MIIILWKDKNVKYLPGGCDTIDQFPFLIFERNQNIIQEQRLKKIRAGTHHLIKNMQLCKDCFEAEGIMCRDTLIGRMIYYIDGQMYGNEDVEMCRQDLKKRLEYICLINSSEKSKKN